jgi:hypothetical protein
MATIKENIYSVINKEFLGFSNFVIGDFRELKEEELMFVKEKLESMIESISYALSLNSNDFNRLRSFVLNDDRGFKFFEKLMYRDCEMLRTSINNSFSLEDLQEFFDKFPSCAEGKEKMSNTCSEFSASLKKNFIPEYNVDETVRELAIGIANELGISKGTKQYDVIISYVNGNFQTIFGSLESTSSINESVCTNFSSRMKKVHDYFVEHPFVISSSNFENYQELLDINGGYELIVSIDGPEAIQKSKRFGSNVSTTVIDNGLVVVDSQKDERIMVSVDEDEREIYECSSLDGSRKYLSMTFDADSCRGIVKDYVNGCVYNVSSVGCEGYSLDDTSSVLDFSCLATDNPGVAKYISKKLSQRKMVQEYFTGETMDISSDMTFVPDMVQGTKKR